VQVETTPEQLARSSELAERASQATGTTTRVIGWYHSHPHITVLPSAVGACVQLRFRVPPVRVCVVLSG
jgi:BRCA1/BRCA2-containing complex subunit 3